ncbi:unnamed protein product [Ectocarpus sp. CCAP 1310/34]|nr:unnamed protein product [Ectocarpus sp. CCAP 1310/34]
MRASCVLAAGLCGIAATEAFVFNPAAASVGCRPASRRQQMQEVAAAADVGGGETDGKQRTWDMHRWPDRSKEFKAMPSDARNWEVEGERLQVWDDEPNPVEELTGNEWYHTFAPSDVEIEAAEMGFDWTDEWFEVNGMARKDLMTPEELQEFEAAEAKEG